MWLVHDLCILCIHLHFAGCHAARLQGLSTSPHLSTEILCCAASLAAGCSLSDWNELSHISGCLQPRESVWPESVAKRPSPCSKVSVMSEVNSVLNLNMNKSKGPGESRVQGSDAAKPCMSRDFMIERHKMAQHKYELVLVFGFGAIQKSSPLQCLQMDHNGSGLGIEADVEAQAWLWNCVVQAE